MRTFKRFQTVYKKLISSYIIVIFLTVIMVAVIMHSYSSRLLRDEMINFGSEVIARISETLDKQVFNRVERLWLECAVSDNKLSSAITNSGTLKHYDYYDIFTELTRLKNQNSDIITGIDMYIGGRKVLISSSGNGNVKFTEYEPDSVPKEFRGIIEKGEVGGGWYISEEGALYFYRTVPYIADSKIPFRGYAAIYVNSDFIKNILSSEQTEEAYFSILDKNGNLLLSSGGAAPEEKTVKNILDKCQKNYCENADGYIVNAARMSSEGMYLVRMMPDSIFFNKLSHMKLILWGICALFALAGFGLSVIFARQIYNPIKRIVSNIQKFSESEDDRHINEYRIIDGAINSLSDKLNSLENEAAQGRELLKARHVLSLLSGENAGAEIDFNYDGFCAAVIEPKPMECEMYEIEAALGAVSCDCNFYCAKISGGRLGVIANFKNFRDAETVFETLPRFGAYVAVGGVCDADGLAVSYNDAVTCLQYKLFTDESVLYSSRWLYRELSDEKFGEAKIKAFKAALRNGSESAVYSAIDALTDEILNSECSYKQARNRMYSIFSVFFNFILEENKNPSYGVTESTYAELNRCENLSSFREWLKNEAGEYLLGAEDAPVVKTGDMIEAAKHIIEENIDKDISLTFVADRLYIAPSYLSRVFKNETGENFNSYITDRRLELARRLIIETNYSVNVITKKTGFNSATYLIKCFKKKYGQTPVNYKKNYIISQNGGA